MLSCIFYFYTWCKHTAHCKHLCFRLSCIFREVKHKKNKRYLSSLLPRSALSFPISSSASKIPASPFTSSNKFNLLSRASPAGSKSLVFTCLGKMHLSFFFLKGGFHWGQDSWLKGIYPLCQHHDETASVCQGSHSFWAEVLCSFGLELLQVPSPHLSALKNFIFTFCFQIERFCV